MPCLRASRWSSTAPASEPWSVSVTAGIPSSAARSASAGMRHAPSRIEYSEWTCRWTKSASGTGRATLLSAQDRTSERPGEQHAALAGSVVALDFGLDVEAQAPVERDRAGVLRRRDAVHGGAARFARGHEESLVQLAREPGATVLRRDADEVDVRLAGIGLGEE